MWFWCTIETESTSAMSLGNPTDFCLKQNHPMQEQSKYQSTSKALTANDVTLNYTKQVRQNPTEKERFENWFIAPLSKLDGDDSIICLMIVFPLLEKILRYDLTLPAEQSLTCSDNSPALKLLAKLLTIPETEARTLWDCFRNGLLHRAMIKGDIPYVLDPERKTSRPAIIQDGIIRIYVWKLRDMVIDLLWTRGKQMWKDETHPLPAVH